MIPESDVDLVRGLGRRILRSIRHHEESLREDHQRFAVAKALMRRLGIEIDQERCLLVFANDDEDIAQPANPKQLAEAAVGRALWGIAYHENNLRKEHANLAALKALLERGKYIEISLDEIAESLRREAEDNAD